MVIDQTGAATGWRPPDAIGEHVVDVLDNSSAFVSEMSRHLLLRRVERHLGRRLYLPDHTHRRHWFVALVAALDDEPGGPAALSRAVADLARNSRLAEVVATAARAYDEVPHAGAGTPGTPGTFGAAGGPGEAGAAGGPGHPVELPDAGYLGVSTATTPTGGTANPVAGTAGRHELTATELSELAHVFHRPASVTDLLDSAGVPRERQPVWDGLDAIAYWRILARLLHDGIVLDGPRKVLEAAAERFPGNPTFTGRGSG